MENKTPMRLARERAGISTEELAFMAKISWNTLRHIEQGRSARLDTLILICDVLKISIDEYIGRTVPNEK